MWFEWILVIIFGLCFGSFANVIITRVPHRQSIFCPPSHCEKCQTSLQPHHLIPLFSYLLLFGRCAFCHQRISWIYPFTECCIMILACISFYFYSFSVNTILIFLFFTSFFIATLIDAFHQEVHAEILFFVLLLSCIFLYFNSEFFLNSLIEPLAIIGFICLLSIFLQAILHKKVIGEGDIVVLAATAILINNLYLFNLILLSSSCLALIWLLIKKQQKIALLPFLFFPTFYLFFGQSQ
ncbi:prepilin peptidase [Helicobacter monodelphidis]|uniref:prepilin peptidase n=1 Tax=Helicobacter sp. 15-1451 TaxID=2004995 RepID=UPI000DD32202|nr:A24 family peptidase [Helicobacter sp. 15-1451]